MSSAVAKEQVTQAVGRAIRERRLELNMTQQELGIKCGKTRSCIYGYENGTIMPNLIILYQLADALGYQDDISKLLPRTVF